VTIRTADRHAQGGQFLERNGDENTGYVRYHSSDDMEGLGEFRGVTEPVAVVLRPHSADDPA
jgi:hypothetical protein